MKIFFESKTHHSRAMNRVQEAIKKHAPTNIQFTSNLNEADVQFLHMIGTGELDDLKKTKFVLFPYCFEAMTKRTIERSQEYFKRANLIFSYLDIPTIINSSDMNFLKSPLGVDTNLFKKSFPEYKDVLITTTGYVSGSEGIESCVTASSHYGKFSIHIGGDLSNEIGYDLSNKFMGLYHRKENISDSELVISYNRSHYVSGLRRFEGFEFPILEGILCGARPICFDLNCYKQWFGNLAIYVPQCDHTELTQRLIKIFSENNTVTNQEIEYVKNTFSWDVIATNFWNEFIKTI